MQDSSIRFRGLPSEMRAMRTDLSTIRNEQTKLTATFLNGLAIASFAVGGLAPSVGMASGSVPASPLVAFLMAYCLIASLALHLIARRFLRRMTT